MAARLDGKENDACHDVCDDDDDDVNVVFHPCVLMPSARLYHLLVKLFTRPCFFFRRAS